MDKIRQVKRSFESLLKVWISKLDYAEEDLVSEDLIWFSETFDDFFTGSNLEEFINRDGRYQNRLELDQIDFTQLLNSSIEFNNSKEERWSRLKVEKPSQFEYYRQLNEFNSENYKNYNIIDIYLRILKRLYATSSDRELERTKNIVLSRILSTVYKVSVFEKKGFNSISLLSDFYYGVLKGMFTKKEVLNDLPDEDFLKTVLFVSIFNVYYLSLLNFKKVPLLKRYLLNIWIYLNGFEKDELLESYLNSLADMTLSNPGFKEIDLFEIRSLLKKEHKDSELYKSLEIVKSKGNRIILLNELEDHLKLIKETSKIKVPNYLHEKIPSYFLKVEEEEAIQLYKFRSMQAFVLEYLSVVLHFRDKDYFVKAFNLLRKNEQWSNHRTFFPKSINDVLVWLILFWELKREMNFRIEASFGYKFLDEIIVFLFKEISFNERDLKHALSLRGVSLDSSFLNSMTSISSDILNKLSANDLISDKEKESSTSFWESLVDTFGGQIQKSESLTPIKSNIFDGLISDISKLYEDKSLVFFLSNNLSRFDRKEESQKELRTFVVASDLQLRKYMIPNWYSPAYGLSESIGRYLFEEENMQLDYNFFSKQISLQSRELKREDVQSIFDKYRKESLFVFRNAYPDFWLKTEKLKHDQGERDSTIEFTYNTFDRNSELIIIPKSSMSIQYLIDGRFKNLQFLNNYLMWEFLDLGGGNEENLLKVKSIKGFADRYNLSDEELKKRFWIRVVAKAKIIIKDKSSILRFKLNPYGE